MVRSSVSLLAAALALLGLAAAVSAQQHAVHDTEGSLLPAYQRLGKLHLGLALPGTADDDTVDSVEQPYEFEFGDDDSNSIDTDGRPAGVTSQHVLEDYAYADDGYSATDAAPLPPAAADADSDSSNAGSSNAGALWLPVPLPLQPAAGLAADLTRSIWQAMQQLEESAATALQSHQLSLPLLGSSSDYSSQQDSDSWSDEGSSSDEGNSSDEGSSSSSSSSSSSMFSHHQAAAQAIRASLGDTGVGIGLTVQSSGDSGCLMRLLRSRRGSADAAAAAVADDMVRSSLAGQRAREAAQQQQMVQASILGAIMTKEGSVDEHDFVAASAVAAAASAAIDALRDNDTWQGVDLQVEVTRTTTSRPASWSRTLLIVAALFGMQVALCVLVAAAYAHIVCSGGGERDVADTGKADAASLDVLVEAGLYKKLLSYA